MEVIRDIQTLKDKIKRIAPETVGLIHTKGALHEGHRSLIQAARKENYLLVVSNILIPREFGYSEAYSLYPKVTEKHLNMASLAGADFFFMPSVKDFEAMETLMGIKLGSGLKDEYNGKDRPGYYEEQLTTMLKLLNIVKPTSLYMSDKDLQQVYFTKRLLKQFHYDCALKVLPVVRDENHIVLGGKNQLLKDDERKQVAELYKVFNKAQTAFNKGMISSKKMKWHVENEMSKLYLCKLEFVEIMEPNGLRKVETITDDAILLLGIRVGKLRICDYVQLKKSQ